MNTLLEAASMRREPRQARAQQRVDTILSAAEALFGEAGYEATSTNQIALRADVPIGSLYQFFPNKEAILQAVAQRYADGFFAAFQRSLPDVATSSINDIVNALIDGTFGFGLQHAGYVSVILRASEGGATGTITQQFQQALIERIAHVIQQAAPGLGLAECKLHARIAQAAIRAHCAIAIAEHLAGNKAVSRRIIEQAKRMQAAYFTHVLRESQPQTA